MSLVLVAQAQFFDPPPDTNTNVLSGWQFTLSWTTASWGADAHVSLAVFQSDGTGGYASHVLLSM